MKRLCLSVALTVALFSSCSSTDTLAPLAEPVAKGRAMSSVRAEEMVVGEPITQALKDWATTNAQLWEELWGLVKENQQ